MQEIIVVYVEPDFARMTAEQLNNWYESTVGYRPQIDDSTMTDDDLRELCRERFEAEYGSAKQ